MEVLVARLPSATSSSSQHKSQLCIPGEYVGLVFLAGRAAGIFGVALVSVWSGPKLSCFLSFSMQFTSTVLNGGFFVCVVWCCVCMCGRHSNLDHKVLQECANTMDASLNHAYRRWRNGDMIGPLELRIVKEGTFNKVMVLAIERGTSLSTYKPPRCVKNPQSLELLKTETLVSFHSAITPDATPLPTL